MAYSVSNEAAEKMLYSGDGEPREWFKIFEVRCAINEWEDDQKFRNIRIFLDAKAKRLVDAAEAIDTTSVDSYEKIKQIIINGCQKTADLYLSNYLAAKRNSNEPMSKYARRLQELLIKAMPSLGVNERTQLLRAQLCNEVPSNLKALIQFSTSFGDGNWDKILDMLDKTVPSTSLTSVDIIKKGPSSNEEFEVNNANMNRGQRYYGNNNNNNSRNFNQDSLLTCYTCGEPGHKSMNCPKRRNNYTNNNFGGYRNSYNNQPNNRNLNNNYNSGSRPQLNRVQQRGGGFGYQNQSQQHSNNGNYNNLAQNKNVNSVTSEQFGSSGPDMQSVYSNSTSLDMNFPFYTQMNQHFNNENNQQNSSATSTLYGNVLEMEVSVLKMNPASINVLLKINVSVSLFGVKQEISAVALLDGGSSHSFLSPDVITHAHRRILNDPGSLWIRRQMHRINGVVSGTDSMCCLVTADLGIETTNEARVLEQELVISGSVRGHDMILGRDFLKTHDITIRHGSDIIEFNNSNDIIRLHNAIKPNLKKVLISKPGGSDLNFSSLETDAEGRKFELKNEIKVLEEQLANLKVIAQPDGNSNKLLIDLDVNDLKTSL